jgi:HEAT repeat protein
MVIALSAVVLLSQRGVQFGDRSSVEWAQALDRDPPTAKASLRAGGVKAIPILVELLHGSDSLTASNAAELLHLLASEDESALQPLFAARKHPSVAVRYWAIRALANRRNTLEETVPALVEALQDPVASIRLQAARALGNLGPTARPAVPDLARSLEDRNQMVRVAAAAALVRLDRANAQALELLLQEASADSPMEYRCRALEALEALGPAAAEAAPGIRKLLQDPSSEVRRAADNILKQMAAPAAAAPAPAGPAPPAAAVRKRLPRP